MGKIFKITLQVVATISLSLTSVVGYGAMCRYCANTSIPVNMCNNPRALGKTPLDSAPVTCALDGTPLFPCKFTLALWEFCSQEPCHGNVVTEPGVVCREYNGIKGCRRPIAN